jgi:hypothetical protein
MNDVTVEWKPQTDQAWDPLATIVEVAIQINDATETISAVLDPGADFTVLQPRFLETFAIDEDACGYLEAAVDANGMVTATVPLTMAVASFGGHDFAMPVQFDKELLRPCLIGRSGFLEHFRIELDPATASTRFVWQGQSPKATLGAVETFIQSRVGKRPKL